MQCRGIGPHLVARGKSHGFSRVAAGTWGTFSEKKPKTTPKAEQSPLREHAGYHGGFPWWLSGKESTCQCKRHRFNPWVRKIPWRRKWLPTPVFLASPVAQLVKNPPTMQETWVQSLGGEDPLEEDMATSSSILAWRIPWTGEPGGLQSMGL